MVEHSIRLVSHRGEESATAAYDVDGPECRLVFKYRDKTIEESASDCFEAFCRVRERLEEEGLRPVCYGASLNVYPSGVCRDMGCGLKAYRLTMGKHARFADLVYIFDSGADVTSASVAEQRMFAESWAKSERS